jgi:hypothetical protein
VWTRWHGDELVVVHHGAGGPVEVARHQRSTKGHPRILTEGDSYRQIEATTGKGVTPLTT